MKPLRIALVFAVIAGLLQAGGTPLASAGGGAPPAACEIAKPQGPEISIRIGQINLSPPINNVVDVTNVQVTSVYFRGKVFNGPFNSGPGLVEDVLSTMDVACGVFNDVNSPNSLSDQIIAATGMPFTSIAFTRCSFLGPDPDPNDPKNDRNGCTAKAGTISTPPGWTQGLVTGYGAK